MTRHSRISAALLCLAWMGLAASLAAQTPATSEPEPSDPETSEPEVTAEKASNESRLFPDFGLHLMGARYAPTQPDLQWTSWIGGSVGLFRIGKASAYGSAEVQTEIGSERRGFDASQAAWELELGVRRRYRDWLFEGFFHHVSRHLVDRDKEQAIDWNLLGVRVLKQIPTGLGVPVRAGGSIAFATLASGVGYEFVATARLEADLWQREDAGVYLRLGARLVALDPEEPLLRGNFVDLTIETGGRLTRGDRMGEIFVTYERRNDVYLDRPAQLDRALFGIRFGVGDPASLGGLQGGFGPSLRVPRAE